MNDFIDNFAAMVIKSKLSSKWAMLGCSEVEIAKIEIFFKLKLPKLYKDFLRKMGRRAGRFMQGTDVFYGRIFENRQAMEEVLELDQFPQAITDKTFVFSSHQGYIFHFFETGNENDDPPVYGYREGEKATKQIDGSFSEFLIGALADESRDWKGVN